MQNKATTLILLVFLAMNIPLAHADYTASPTNTAAMDDAALASYITGRLKQVLDSNEHQVEQYCDTTGCSVVVH